MGKKLKKQDIPTQQKPNPKLARRWLGAKITQHDTVALENKETDPMAKDVKNEGLKTDIGSTVEQAQGDMRFTDQLQKLLSEPLISQETMTEILDRLQEERLQLEQLTKQVSEERITFSALKAEADHGFATDRQKAIEEKETMLKQLEEESHKKLEEMRQEASEFIEQQKAIIRKRESELNQREQLLLDQEIALETKQANAKAGFIEEQKKAIEQYREQITQAQKQLTQLKTQHVDELSRHKQSLGSIESEHLESLQNQLEKKQTHLDEQSRQLTDNEAGLEEQRSVLNREKALLSARQRSQDSWEADTQKKIQDEFAYEIEELKTQLERMKSQLHNEQNKNEALQNELREFADLQNTFDDSSAEEIHSRFRQLQKENRELKAKQYLNDEDLGEKCDILEEQLGDRTDEIRDMRVELEEAKAELHKRNISVMEKQNLVQEKRILEQHKRTLDASIEQLRTQVDDLIERQQGSETFPALSSMDKKHRIAASNLQPVPKLKDFAGQLRCGMASIYENSPLYYREEDVRFFLGGLAMSNLHILQGMSGTGKTSLAKAFAKVVGGHCTDIAVQAGWRDKDDLLGHYNAFEKRFYERETLQALYRAQLPEYKDRINIILLDEMNLSRPEQYFAEFLSAIEMRPEERKIVLVESEQKNAPTLLTDGRILRVPENVWFIGTANHDETTNEFADKTYDRAHVMELIRNEGTFNADAYEPGITYSFKSLQNAFNMVCQNSKAKEPVEKILNDLAESDLARVLESDFGVSWGNRFGRHALRFLPVVNSAGGTYEEALDHLLATKVFRHGKATGRYDLTPADLDNVSSALVDTWDLLGMKNEPEACLKAIDKDRKRMERGA